MSILDGIKNFLQVINNNWTTIAVIIGLSIAAGKKIVDFAKKSTEEKIAIAKQHVKEAVLRMVTEAEIDFEEWNKAGSIKRSQVITEIFEEYPILSKVIDQDELIAWIDELIDNALVTLREVIEENEKSSEPAEEAV